MSAPQPFKRRLAWVCFRLSDFCGRRSYYAEVRFGWGRFGRFWLWLQRWWNDRARHFVGLPSVLR